MTQESTMICVDNSEWMRNGDLPPTRFNCQQEAVRALIHFKLRSNPENAVGLVSLANRIDVLNSLTAEDRKLMVRLHSLEILGISKVFDGLKTAYLALKHRKNRNHRQRIVVFVGSPLDPLLSEKEPFLKFAKKLKKEKVSADFVLFGEATAENNKIIADFVDILNGAEDGASHLLVVPVGDTKLFDALIRSPICNGAAGAVIGAGGDFGINEEDDPELAMALRISLEEQRLRQQQQTDGAGQPQQQQQNAAVPMEVDQQQSKSDAPTAPAETGQRIHQEEPNLSAMTEEEQLEYVLRLSMSGNQPAQGGQDGQQNQQQSRSPSGAMSTPAPTPMELEEGTGGSNAQGAAGGVQLGDLLAHPEMLRQMVGQAPVAGGGAEGTSKERQKESKESDEKGGGAKKEANENNEKKGKEDKKDGNANDKMSLGVPNNQKPSSGRSTTKRQKVELKPGRGLTDWIGLSNAGRMTPHDLRSSVDHDELSRHNTERDCWILLFDMVHKGVRFNAIFGVPSRRRSRTYEGGLSGNRRDRIVH
uniref:26S proteasome non-ATPase regulatory subunit 4 n=1 Tax=Globodera rostochiensis TaxID=31243 RepID=A0A914HA35_GLORO